MNSRSKVDTWLIAVGESVGKRFKLNDSGIFVAENQEKCEFVIEVPGDDSQILYFYSPIVSVPETNKEKFFEKMLVLNLFGTHTRYCTLSLDSAYNKITLHTVQSIDDLDATSFFNVFNNFIEASNELRREINEFLSTFGENKLSDRTDAPTNNMRFGFLC